MAQEKMFKRAELSRPVEDGVEKMQSWIPSDIAIVGATVRLKDNETGIWTENWKVDSATLPEVPESILVKRSRDYKKTRLASDI